MITHALDMSKRLTGLPFLVAALGLFAVAAQAQSFSATPIEIDVTDAQDAGEPLLIAAYRPQVGVAAQFMPLTPGASRVAFAPDTGLPSPSIILGRVAAGQEAAFGIEALLPATVAEIGFDASDLEARAALRQSDPVLFRQLVQGGHVDPPEAELRVVLQTELARMNCYRSGIDGAWGPGSRRSVSAYFAAVEGAEWPDQQPTFDLFREIVMREDIRCAAPVAAARSNTNTARTTTRQRSTAQPRRTPRQTTQPAQTTKPKIDAGAGIGVFR